MLRRLEFGSFPEATRRTWFSLTLPGRSTRRAPSSLSWCRARDESHHVVHERLEAGAIEAAPRHEPVDVRRIVRRVAKVAERVEMVGGVFSVDSAPGKGTTIRAQIPMNGGR